MTAISFQDGDNFIRNACTILGDSRPWSGAHMRTVSTGTLPVSVDEIMEDLRVDDPDADEETVGRLARGACAFIARRTGFVLLPTVFELTAAQWWGGGLEILRGPFRETDAVEYQATQGVWTPVAGDAFWAAPRERSFVLRLLADFDRPTLWQPEDCIRVRFSCGFDGHDETGTDPIEDGLRTILLLVTGHYYANREMLGLADPKYGLQAVELGATSLLGQYRQFW